jgi:hypothetical protein
MSTDTVSPGAWIFLFVMIFVGYYMIWSKQGKYPMAYVESTVDKERYYVRNLPDKQQAADRLARVREKTIQLRDHLEKTHGNIQFVKQILKNFQASPDQFSESTPEAVHTSYTVDKEKVFMCLRQRNEREELVQENVIMFVGLHEIAHVGTESIGHTPEFWNNFAWLLQQAEKIKIYTYTDFAAHPVEYCGVHITDSPTYKGGVEDGIKVVGSSDDVQASTE